MNSNEMRPTGMKVAAVENEKCYHVISLHAEWSNQSNGIWQKTAYGLQNEKTVSL